MIFCSYVYFFVFAGCVVSVAKCDRNSKCYLMLYSFSLLYLPLMTHLFNYETMNYQVISPHCSFNKNTLQFDSVDIVFSKVWRGKSNRTDQLISYSKMSFWNTEDARSLSSLVGLSQALLMLTGIYSDDLPSPSKDKETESSDCKGGIKRMYVKSSLFLQPNTTYSISKGLTGVHYAFCPSPSCLRWAKTPTACEGEMEETFGKAFQREIQTHVCCVSLRLVSRQI